MTDRHDKISVLEAELASVRRELVDRTMELEVEREKSSAAETAKARFLAMLSHEMRTPLNAIIGFSDLMESEQFGPLGNETYKGYAGDIRYSGRHMLSLVDDLLTVSQMQAGRMAFKDAEVDPVELIESVCRLMLPESHKKSLRIDIRLAPNLGMIVGDERALRQMLINVVGNAIRYSNQSGHIVISARDSSDDGLAITVSDNGIGISAEKVERVFEPFFQASQGNARSHEGAGLGLSIAKSVAEQHNSEISLQSQEGIGTSVTILLPPSRIIHDSSIDDMTQFDDGDGDVDMSVWLSVTYAGREQRVYQDGGEFIIGRPDVRQQDLICDLSLKDSRVSRPHARIVHSKGHFYLIDHSRRGSYVEREGGDVEFVHQGMSAALEDEGHLYLADEPSHPETIRIGFALHRSQDRNNGHLRAVS